MAKRTEAATLAVRRNAAVKHARRLAALDPPVLAPVAEAFITDLMSRAHELPDETVALLAGLLPPVPVAGDDKIRRTVAGPSR